MRGLICIDTTPAVNLTSSAQGHRQRKKRRDVDPDQPFWRSPGSGSRRLKVVKNLKKGFNFSTLILRAVKGKVLAV